VKKSSRRYRVLEQKVDRKKIYTLEEAVLLLKELHTTRFDETVNLSVNLGIDPKKIQQPIRGSVTLPHGTGKTVRVLVLAQGEAAEKAAKAGADYVGGQELVDKIKAGWLEFDAVVATPDMMKLVAPLGKILGPRGLMPSPKTGTVTFDVDQMTTELKKGRVEFRMDRDGNVQLPVGKVSFPPEKLTENISAALEAIADNKPAAVKGQYFRVVALSLTMSPSVRVAPPRGASGNM